MTHLSTKQADVVQSALASVHNPGGVFVARPSPHAMDGIALELMVDERSLGYVTISFNHRMAALGLCNPKSASRLPGCSVNGPYQGRGWQALLIKDAGELLIKATSEVERKPLR